MALPKRAADPAQSSAGAEQEPAASEPELPAFELRDGWWVLPRYGARMKLPAGWEPRERHARPFAHRDPSGSLSGSLNVLSLPNFYGADLARLAEESRSALETDETLELIALEEHCLADGHPAFWMDYRGSPYGTELRFAAIVFLFGPDQVVITAAAVAEQWPGIEDDVRASLESIELLAP